MPGDGRRRARLEDKEDCDVRQVRRWSPKAGAWVQDQIPGIEEPFIKPWMIDMADDQYTLDITRARDLLGWSPRRSLGWNTANEIKQAASNATPREPGAWH